MNRARKICVQQFQRARLQISERGSIKVSTSINLLLINLQIGGPLYICSVRTSNLNIRTTLNLIKGVGYAQNPLEQTQEAGLRQNLV